MNKMEYMSFFKHQKFTSLIKIGLFAVLSQTETLANVNILGQKKAHKNLPLGRPQYGRVFDGSHFPLPPQMVFCGNKLCNNSTHLRTKGKEVTCPGHEDCTAIIPPETTIRDEKRWATECIGPLVISQVMEIVLLLPVHLKSKSI